MTEYWATETGRWRRKMLLQAARSLGERVYAVIRADIEEGILPAGARMSPPEHVAQELAIDATDLRAAYARLIAESHLERRADGALLVRGIHPAVDGALCEATQIRFEVALLASVREAAARGLRGPEASGLFRAAMHRIRDIERAREARRED